MSPGADTTLPVKKDLAGVGESVSPDDGILSSL